MTEIVSDIASTIKNTPGDFYKFMIENNVIGVGMAFILSTQINTLANGFITNIIAPIIKAISTTQDEDLKQVKINILGAYIEVGAFIETVLKFLLTMLLIFYFFRFFSKSDSK